MFLLALRARAIAAGWEHSLALKSDGTMVAWGRNQYGQTNVPAGLADVIAISAGSTHNLALKADGTVVAWGDNYSGQTNVPAGLSGVQGVAAGYQQSYAMKADGTVVGWGSGFSGSAIPLPGVSNVVAIGAGNSQTLALRADGSVCAIGPAGIEAGDFPAGLSNLSAISVGASHALAILPDGPPEILDQPGAVGVAFQSNAVLSVTTRGFEPLSYQWFFNGYALAASDRIVRVTNASLSISNAQFSDIGTYTVVVSNGLGIVQSTGAVLTVICPPTFTQQPAGQTVLAGTNVTLTAGAFGTPPLRYQWLLEGTALAGATRTSLSLSNVQPSQSGNYSLLASNVYGVTGSSNALLTALESPPYILSQPASRTATVGGSTTFTVDARGSTPLSYQWRFNGEDIAAATTATLALTALRSDQAGYYAVAISNALGEIVSAKAQLSLLPVAIWGSWLYAPTNIPAGLSNLVAIAAGDYHLLGLKSDGRLVAWGSTRLGPPPVQGYLPTNIPPGLSNVAAIAAASTYNLVVQSNGIVRAWGAAPYGQTNVPGSLSNVIAIAAGMAHCLALKSDGRVIAWGAWRATNIFAPPPQYAGLTNVPAGLSNVIAISAGSDHSLALKQDGTVAAWGLPDTTRLPMGLSNVIAVAAAEGYSLALQSNGKVTAWTASSIPYPIIEYPPLSLPLPTNVPSTLSNVVAIAANSEALALKADGTVAYWTGITNGVRPEANVFAITAGANFSAGLPGDGSPHFTIQPASQTVSKGGTVRLHARAAGVQPLLYQWEFEGAAVPGATNGTLILANVTGRNSGAYRAVVSNALATATSLVAAVTISFNTNLAAALNTTNLTWTGSGTNAPWFAQNRETHDGDAAAQSGRITHNQQSILQTTVVGPGTLTFWWEVSSEESYDRLSFYVDVMSSVRSISGETDWQPLTMAIPTGSHVVRWVYSKDGTVSAGRDAGWVDQVSFTPASPLNLTGLRMLPDGTVVLGSKDPVPLENLSLIAVQASTNLRDWSTLPGACTITNGALRVPDPVGVQYPLRFYRVLEH
jgi:alpha-tubulin suppressor-like RCC1 family protein